MPGFDNDVLFCSNVDFRGVKPVVGQVTTNGQLLIGSTVSPHIKVGSLTSTGGTIAISTGSGTINLETADNIVFVDTSGSFLSQVNHGYFLTDTSTATLPAAPSQGDLVIFVADTTNSVVITANAGQSIRFANSISSVGGTWTNSAQGDSLTLYYQSSSSTWFVTSSLGIWVPS